MAIGSPQWMYKSGEAYEIDQSLRFNDDDSAYLSWTPSSAGNRTTWTWSGWIKLGSAGDGWHMIFSAGSSSNSGSTGENLTGLLLYNDTLYIYWDSAAGGTNPAMKLRDPSAWYHVCLVATSSSLACYINGTLAGTKSGSGNGAINNTLNHGIGIRGDSLTSPFDGYMSEIHFIDGTAKAPSNFAETGDYGEWKPKEYSGTYGTNGFYLPFKQDYTVEGFSTVTYKGNGTSQYIGGTGFQPDLTWIKRRNDSNSHRLQNSVTGSLKSLSANQTGAELVESDGDGVLSFNPDGFRVGYNDSNMWNGSGATYVAWNWDMGDSHGLKHTITANGNIQHSTAQSKIGSSSIALDGTNDFLTIPDSDDWSFINGDFTIETWVRLSASQESGIYAQGSDANNMFEFFLGTDQTCKVKCYDGGSTIFNFEIGGSLFATNTWTHIALVKKGSVFTYYQNGSADGTATDTSVAGDETGVVKIGVRRSESSDLNGYMDEYRISNVARYHGDFTPSTTAFTSDSNTLLLIQSDTSNGSTTFTDSSGDPLNTDGSIDSRVKANTTYGQSIVSYTGNSSTNQTVGHGLSSTPDIVIIKNRDDASAYWSVINPRRVSAADPNILYLNDAMAEADSTNIMGDNLPTATTVGVDDYDGTNKNGNNFIMYCWHSVTGYSSIGSYTGNGSNTGTVVNCGFAPAFLMVKKSSGIANWYIYDNAREPEAEKGKALLANSSNAEGGDYERLKFTSTGFQLTHTDADLNGDGQTYVYMAFADTREYAYWLDQSGNNNDWTSNNLTESDISVDSPTNNFATLNAVDASTNATLSQGNLRVVTNSSDYGTRRSTIGVSSGKYYAEVYCEGGTDGTRFFIGAQDFNVTLESNDAADSSGYAYHSGTGAIYHNGSQDLTGGSTYTTADIIGVAIDCDVGTIKFYKNNSLQYTKSGLTLDNWGFVISDRGSTTTYTMVANFGQDSSFAGNKTAQGNQDSNDIGDFYYTPPTGFLALCTKNLPDVAVVPSEHFNTVLYTGTGSSQSVDIGFQTDFVWNRKRNDATNFYLQDVVRGFGASKSLSSNTTSQEGYDGNPSSQSLSVGSSAITVNGSDLNENNLNFVSWNWKANGSGSSNTNGSVTSTVSANVDAGFSIVDFTSGSGSTVGHGLSKAPELVIFKRRDTNQNWIVMATEQLNGSNQGHLIFGTDAIGYSSSITLSSGASTLTIGSHNAINSLDVIAYCFHSVDGYSKVGSYTGNGNDDGTFVYTGFRPAWVMTKKTSSTSNWTIIDSTRSEYNDPDDNLQANTNIAEFENTRYDILSNGFKMRRGASGDTNTSGATYIYIAFAETPFKYSNAR